MLSNNIVSSEGTSGIFRAPAYLQIRTEIRWLEGAGFVRCSPDEFELQTSIRLKEIQTFILF